MWKRSLARALLVVLGCAVPLLIGEGVHSVLRGRRGGTSLVYELWARWRGCRQPLPFDPRDPNTWVITDLSQFQSMMDLFVANGVGIGNSPFDELRSDAVAINRERDGCREQKPNLRKTMGFLRSNLFNPFDQLTYFHDTDRPLPSALDRFFREHELRRVHLTTNADGERLTVPDVAADDIVLIAGDSVANGAMLDDTETLSSRLQRGDPRRRYVNLGIVGAETKDIACALDQAARRYAGRMRELIYVFCENDFDTATPQVIAAGLLGFARREHVGQVVLVYVPYIYNVVPEVTRIRGHSHRDFPTYREAKRALLDAATEGGAAVIDFGQIAIAAERSGASQFAPLALYLDHTHPSPPGIERLAAALEAQRAHPSPSAGGGAGGSPP